MNIKRSLKLVILIPLLIIAVVYVSIPFISKHLIENKLPANIQLLEWDMNFLGLNKLCIEHATIKIEIKTIENEISVHNACINYFSKNIDVDKIITKTYEQTIVEKTSQKNYLFPIKVPPMFLPKLNLASITQLNKVGKMRVASLESHYFKENNAKFSLLTSNIELGVNLKDSNIKQSASFTIKDLIIDEKMNARSKRTILRGDLNIKIDSETLELAFINSSNASVLNLEFNQTLSQRTLDLTLDANFLNKQFKNFMPKTKFDYLPTDRINIEINRDLILNEHNIIASTSFYQTNSENDIISLELMLSMKELHDADQIALQLSTELSGKTLNSHQLLFEKFNLNGTSQFMFNKLTSAINANLTYSTNTLQFIDKLNGVINIDQPNIIKIDSGEVKNKIQVRFDEFKISLNSNKRLPLDSFESLIEHVSIQGKITGKQLATKIASDNLKLEIGKTDFDEEPTISIDFKLAKKGDTYHSSGKVKISDFLSDMVTTNKDDNLNYKSENIKSALKGVLSWDDLSVSLNVVDDKIRPNIHSSNFELNIEGNDLITSKLDLENFTFNSKASIVDNKLVAIGDFDISKNKLASIHLSNNDIFSNDIPYRLVVKNPKIRNELISQLANSLISKIDSKNEISLTINRGTIEHNNKIKMGDTLSLKSDLALHQFDVDINSIFLIGLNYQQSVNSLEPLKLSAELDIREVTFASGLLLSKISTTVVVNEKNFSPKLNKSKSNEFNIEKNRSINISISNLKANIWNGQIQSESIIIEDGNLKPSIISLKNIDLTELIFFLDMKGLYADGNIDINIPIEQQNRKYIVENGHFASNQPGIIKYDSGQEQVDVEANIALHALQNFHYQKLDGTINYDKNGAYEIKLHLLGSNPSLYDGYPIDFSLNLSGELSDVFQSVFLTGDFEKSIMEKAKMNHLNP